MVLRVAFFILMALGLVGFGTVAWFSLRPPSSPVAASAVPQLAKKKALATARTVGAGTMLKPEDIVGKEVASGDIAGLLSADEPDAVRSLAGSMVKHAMSAGEPIRLDDVMKPGDHGFMAAVLQPGMRAVTIGVDATSGSAGLVWPGDRVDLTLTQSLTDPALPPGRRVSAETILTNARVIAIDQQLMQGGAPAANDNHARTVTLEVNPVEVQRVSVAMRLGRLSLSVRAVSQANTDGTANTAATGSRGDIALPKAGSIFARDVSAALGGEVQPSTERTVRVHHGAAEPKEYKY